MTRTEEQNKFSGVRQIDLCNVFQNPKSADGALLFFFQSEVRVTGFTGGFFIEEPDCQTLRP